jgi:hypothetical protein
MEFSRKGRKTKHHILAKARGGTRHPNNILRLDERRHQAFHFLFGNRTLKEAAAVLIRTAEMKGGYK